MSTTIFSIIILLLCLHLNKSIIQSIPVHNLELHKFSAESINNWSQFCLLHLISNSGSSSVERFFENSEKDHSAGNVKVIDSISTRHLEPNRSILNTFYQTRLGTRTCTIGTLFIGSENEYSSLELYSKSLLTILEYMQTNSFLNENPEYVLLIPAEDQAPLLNNEFQVVKMAFYSSLKFIPVSSKYLVSEHESNSNFIKILFLASDAPVFQKVSKIQHLDEIWMEMHKNLTGTKVLTKRSELKTFMIDGEAGGDVINCNLGKDFRGDVRLCILQLLSGHLNFNLVVKHDAFVERAAVAFRNYIQNPQNRHNLIANELDNWQITATIRNYQENTAGHKLEWISQSLMKDSLSFILVLNKASLRQSAFYRPYDLITWSLILISVLSVSLFLTLSLWSYHDIKQQDRIKKDNAKVRIILTKMILMVLGSIFEQNPSDKTESKHKIRSFRIAFGIWLLASIVISNGYTGIIISFLCSSVLPANVPQDLKDLVESPFPIYTTDTVYVPQDKSTMHYTAALLYEYAYYSSLHKSQVKIHYMKLLYSRTLYLHNCTKGKLLFLYENNIHIPPELSTSNRRETIGPNFAFLSTQTGVDKVFDILSSNHNVLLWRPEFNSETVFILTAFTVARNYFSVVFNRYYNYMSDAGFPGIWIEHEQYHRSRMHKNTNACWKNSNIKDAFETNHRCDYQLFDTTGGQVWRDVDADDEDESKPLELEVLNDTFLLMFIGQLIALVLFWLENCIAHCRGIVVNCFKIQIRRDDGENYLVSYKQESTSMNNKVDGGPEERSLETINYSYNTIPGLVNE